MPVTAEIASVIETGRFICSFLGAWMIARTDESRKIDEGELVYASRVHRGETDCRLLTNGFLNDRFDRSSDHHVAFYAMCRVLRDDGLKSVRELRIE